METLMKPQMGVNSEKATDDYLQYLRQMNISHCFVMFSNEHSNYEDVNRILDKVRKAGLTVDDAGNAFLYKHPSIHLGMDDRDMWIEKYNDLNGREGWLYRQQPCFSRRLFRQRGDARCAGPHGEHGEHPQAPRQV